MISNKLVFHKKIDFTACKNAYPTSADIRFCVSLAISLSVLATAELNSVLIVARMKGTGMTGATDAIILMVVFYFRITMSLSII